MVSFYPLPPPYQHGKSYPRVYPPEKMGPTGKKQRRGLSSKPGNQNAPLPATKAHIKKLPAPILAMIPTHLTTHRDLKAFNLVCQDFNEVLKVKQVWLTKFSQEFDCDDVLDLLTPERTRSAFLQRARSVFRQNPEMVSMHWSKPNARLFAVLGALIKEIGANSGPSITLSSKNIPVIERIVVETGLMDLCGPSRCLQGQGSAAMRAVLLCLTYLSFMGCQYNGYQVPRPLHRPVDRLHAARTEVYASPMLRPLFKGTWYEEVELDLLQHHVNWLQYHLVSDKGEVSAHFKALPPCKRPSTFTSGRPKLGAHLLRATKFLAVEGWPLPSMTGNIRRGSLSVDSLGDEFLLDDEFPFPELQLTQASSRDGMDMLLWPIYFETRLCVTTSPSDSVTRRLKDDALRASKTFRQDYAGVIPVARTAMIHPHSCRRRQIWGTMKGRHVDFVTGWVMPLPAQGGMPGFMRFVMVRLRPSDWILPPSEEPCTAEQANTDKAKFQQRRNAQISYALRFPARHPAPDGSGQMTGGELVFYEGIVFPCGGLVVGRRWTEGEDNAGFSTDAGPLTGIGMLNDRGERVRAEDIITTPPEDQLWGPGFCIDSAPFMLWGIDL